MLTKMIMNSESFEKIAAELDTLFVVYSGKPEMLKVQLTERLAKPDACAVRAQIIARFKGRVSSLRQLAVLAGNSRWFNVLLEILAAEEEKQNSK